jgi:peptidoglycan/LPS O-acetylase OafA/YrhL
MAGERRPQPHLDALDGLRALLALYVVQRHVEVLLANAARWQSPWSLFRYAHFAVDLFIVLSGFCLFLPVVRASGELRGGAWTFFQRRAIRILPPYYAALGLSIALLWVAGQSRQFTGQNFAAVWQHLLLVHDALSPFALNSALWSVAVEVHIYLAFPLLVLSWRRLGVVATFAWASLAAGAVYVIVLRHPWYRVVTPQYLVLFLIGMLGASIHASPRWEETKKIPWGLIAAVLIPAMMAVHYLAPPPLVATYLGVEDLVVGVGGMALILAASRPGLLARALSARPLVAVGQFAYSLYLVHVPLLEALMRFAARHFDVVHPSGATRLVLVVALTAAMTAGAFVFYLVFERPFVRRLSATRRTASAPAAAA